MPSIENEKRHKREAFVPKRYLIRANKVGVRYTMRITDYTGAGRGRRLLAAADASCTRDYLMLRMLWWTGVRINERLNIGPSDIEPTTTWSTSPKGTRQAAPDPA